MGEKMGGKNCKPSVFDKILESTPTHRCDARRGGTRETALSPRGMTTEAFSWLVSVFPVGNAMGVGAAGLAAEQAGVTAVFAVSCVPGAAVAATIRSGTRAGASVSTG